MRSESIGLGAEKAKLVTLKGSSLALEIQPSLFHCRLLSVISFSVINSSPLTKAVAIASDKSSINIFAAMLFKIDTT